MKLLDCTIQVYLNGQEVQRASEYYTKRYQAGLRSPLKGQVIMGRKAVNKSSTETTIIIELQ